MQNSRNLRAWIVVAAGAVIVVGGRLLDWPTLRIFALLGLLLILLWLFTYWQVWHALDWFRRYNVYTARVRKGEADAVIAELTALRDQGNRAPEIAITLAAAYNYLGRGPEAEPLAFEAFDAVDTSAIRTAADLSSRALCDLAYLTRFDMLLAQGRFTEAAGGLREHIRQAVQPNFVTALTAWAYALGDDHEQARDMLGQVKAPGPRPTNALLLSPRFEFTVAYLRHALNDDQSADTIVALRTHRAMIDEWAETAERNAHNPYGKRLYLVVEDMRRVADNVHAARTEREQP